jgi:hypothetical protein
MVADTNILDSLRLWFAGRRDFMGIDISPWCVSPHLSLCHKTQNSIHSFIRVKTKVQQRALAGTPPKGVWETLRRLVRGTADHCSHVTTTQNSLGPDPKDPKPVLAGIARIYRGLGVSAVRSITTHGLLWTFFDITSHYIDHLPWPSKHGILPRISLRDKACTMIASDLGSPSLFTIIHIIRDTYQSIYGHLTLHGRLCNIHLNVMLVR